VYIYTNSKLLHQGPGAHPVRWYNNIFSEDLDPNDSGQEIESEGNDDDNDDDDGVFEVGGAQIGGANELGSQQAMNNNANGQTVDAFD
jgi:hypothetical protein